MEMTRRPSNLVLRQHEEGDWHLTGEVMDVKTKDMIESMVRNSFADDDVVNELAVSDRIKPSLWCSGLERLLGKLSEGTVDGLEVRIKDDVIRLEGEVDSEIRRASVARSVESIGW